MHQHVIMAENDEQDVDNVPEDPEGLNSDYDLIVEGTGLVESIVACAASRCGKTVLHFDSHNYYGRNEANFSLDEFITWCKADLSGKEDVSSQASTSSSSNHAELSMRSSWTTVIEFQDMPPSLQPSPEGGDDASLSTSPTMSVTNVARYTVPKKYHPACMGYAMQPCCNSNLSSSQHIHPAFHGYITDHRLTDARLVVPPNTPS